jgi:hypothetical protein
MRRQPGIQPAKEGEMKIKRGNWKVRECAEHVASLLETYAPRSGDDPETQIADLLTDMQHYCYAHRLDFEDLLRRSQSHVGVEQDPHFSEGRS